MGNSQLSLLGSEENGSRVQVPPVYWDYQPAAQHTLCRLRKVSINSLPLLLICKRLLSILCLPALPTDTRVAEVSRGMWFHPQAGAFWGEREDKTSKLTHTQHLRCGEMLQKKQNLETAV